MTIEEDRKEYQREYYKRNKKKILLYRRLRYATDELYRQSIIKRAEESYEKDCTERGQRLIRKYKKRRRHARRVANRGAKA